jgi:hypothetical protein
MLARLLCYSSLAKTLQTSHLQDGAVAENTVDITEKIKAFCGSLHRNFRRLVQIGSATWIISLLEIHLSSWWPSRSPTFIRFRR